MKDVSGMWKSSKGDILPENAKKAISVSHECREDDYTGVQSVTVV